MKAVTAQRREGRRTSGGVTYASRLGDGGRTARGGWEAPLDPHITQHVQQYLSIRTFYVTHTQAGNMLDMHTHTHSSSRRCTYHMEQNSVFFYMDVSSWFCYLTADVSLLLVTVCI